MIQNLSQKMQTDVMPRSMFLASLSLDGLPDFLEEAPSMLQLLYIPTASNVYESAEFADSNRSSLAEMGFQIDDLDLATASPDRVAQAMKACDVVFVGGGNTYYLLHCMNRSGFREALNSRDDVVYVGSSAGAVVVASDITYIGDLDDPGQAPDLESTRGLGLVDFCVMPHDNDPSANRAWTAAIEADPTLQENAVRITDDQAVTVVGDERRTVGTSFPPK